MNSGNSWDLIITTRSMSHGNVSWDAPCSKKTPRIPRLGESHVRVTVTCPISYPQMGNRCNSVLPSVQLDGLLLGDERHEWHLRETLSVAYGQTYNLFLGPQVQCGAFVPMSSPPFRLSTEVGADDYTVSCLLTDINHVRVEVVIESHIKYIESGIGRVSMDLTLCAFAI